MYILESSRKATYYKFWYEKSFPAIKKACHQASGFVIVCKNGGKVITRGVPEGTLRIGVVVGHRHISLVLATMSTLVVGVKVVHTLVIVLEFYTCIMRTNHFLVQFISHQFVRHWVNN